ncbi:MAG: ubiquinol-cytochrome c reductase iron-sulfur subunit, partial [Actinomycetota bacterium]|nr:ubiquinol-cytochrome c reductase iron-sulfur subunit [Actinomycetota bacterium]
MKTSRAITLSFIVSACASFGLTAVYVQGGQPQLEGALLAISLGGIALGLVFIAKEYLPHGPYVQERHVTLGDPTERVEAEDSLEEGAEQIARRGFIAKLMGLALGALGLAALFPIRSLGTKPGRDLFTTPWAKGIKLVTENGLPVHLDDVPVNGVLTVFPQEYTDAADAQSVLIRLPADETAPGPDGYSVGGLVAFSKVCTHAGCPVGLYQAETRELFCPCHQSVFAVMQAAKPTGGPATRPLPQLPIGVDDDGYLIALGDFPEP